jgi:hypothetical protein
MTEHDDTEAPAVALPAPDAFGAVLTLIGLVVDPKAFRARIADLQKQIAAVDKAQAKLAADRAEYDATITRERAAIEQDREKYVKRWTELNRSGPDIEALTEANRKLTEELDRLKGRRIEAVGPSGLTREFFGHDPDDEPVPDAHYRQVADNGFTTTEKLPGPNTLTRSVMDGSRTARKRARRCAVL